MIPKISCYNKNMIRTDIVHELIKYQPAVVERSVDLMRKSLWFLD